jgi:PDZ domain-containing protein
MDHIDVAPGPQTGMHPDEPTPEQASPPVVVRARLPKWPFVLVGILLLIGTVIAALWPFNVPFYALSPGPVNDTSDFVTVADAAEEDGDLFFLTVSLREINAIEYVAALINGEVDLRPRDNIRPAGVTSEDLRLQNLELMESSKDNAIYVALTQLGYEVTFDGSGAVVSTLLDGSPAAGLLEVGDLIVAVDGETVEFSAEAADMVAGHAPGDVVELTVERPAEDGAVETFTTDITLAPYRFENEDGSVEEDDERGMIGLMLLNGPTTVEFPLDIDIDSQNIGGPSAGLMFTLEIMNQLTDGALTKGHRVAGTGTINADGEVGAIGGVRQKVFAAREIGAEYVLVPAGNYADALTASGDDIQVVSVATVDDAIAFLDDLEPLGS